MVLLGWSGPVYAQGGAGSGLAGRVTDATGASVVGVNVIVSRPEAGFERKPAVADGRDETDGLEATSRK